MEMVALRNADVKMVAFVTQLQVSVPVLQESKERNVRMVVLQVNLVKSARKIVHSAVPVDAVIRYLVTANVIQDYLDLNVIYHVLIILMDPTAEVSANV